MLALALVALAAGDRRSPVELVLARGEGAEDEELNWIQGHSQDARVTLYSKGGRPLQFLTGEVHEVPLTHVGQEAHTYLTHIVKNYDTLAEKTVFMPASKPVTGFSGFQRGAASFLPGVGVPDYLRQDTPPLFVPTMAVTANLTQTSVRMSFMENAREQDVPKGRNFTACTASGQAGWSPLLPNKFGSSVLEPLMKAQASKGTPFGMEAFWAKHLPDTPIPSMIMFAHGAAMSVARDQILSHPKSFYENLLEEVSHDKNPYQAYFLEYMWWYIFNSKATLCPAGRQNERKLYENTIAVLEPMSGADIKFGDVVPISWTTDPVNMGYMQIELWRFGNFETVLATMQTAKSWNWPVFPGHTGSDVNSANRPYDAHATNVNVGDYHTTYNLKPNDKYTIRVCAVLTHHVGTGVHCDSDPYGESGEFDIVPTIDVSSPAAGYVYDMSQPQPATLPYFTVAFTSYYMMQYPAQQGYAAGRATLINAATGYAVSSVEVGNLGVLNYFPAPDTPTGQYVMEVSGTSESGVRTTGRSGVFSIITATSPPPAPFPPPSPSPPPNAPFELPIIKAFRSGFGLGSATSMGGSNGDYSTMSTYSGGDNCEYVCRVYRTVGTGGRRLLFGGLQYANSPQDVVGCTPAQVRCGCCARG